DRYVIAAAAGLYLAVAAGLVTWRSPIGRGLMTAGLLLVMVGALGRYYQSPNKGAWPAAAAWLDQQRTSHATTRRASPPMDDRPMPLLVFASERDFANEAAHVRDNWWWYDVIRPRPDAVLLDLSRPAAAVAADL